MKRLEKGRHSFGWMKGIVLAGVLTFSLSALVPAMDVKITGKKCPLTFTNAADNTEATQKVKKLSVLGVVDNKAAVVIGDAKGYVPLSELRTKLPLLDVNSLPNVSGWTDLTVGSSGDRVRELQQHLINLTHLTGTADGVFGNMTAAGVKSFQTAEGMDATGVADLFTYLYIVQAGTGGAQEFTTEYPTVIKAEDKFAQIVEKVTDLSVLDPYLDMQWTFTYDLYERKGEITRGKNLGSYSKTDRDVDRISITVDEFVYVYEDEAKEVQVIPALKVSSIGAYRPCVESVIVLQGNDAWEMPVISSERSFSGTSVQEVDVAAVDSEFWKKMMTEDMTGFQVRVKGKNANYDFQIQGLGELQSLG